MSQRYFAPGSPASVGRSRIASRNLVKARAELQAAQRDKEQVDQLANTRKRVFSEQRELWAKFQATGALEKARIDPDGSAAAMCYSAELLNLPRAQVPLLSPEDIRMITETPSDDLTLLQIYQHEERRKANELADATMEHLDANEREHKSVSIQTTLANAMSVQLFAEYFAERGASRVFEDAVRPWCSRAILAPPPPPPSSTLKLRNIMCTCCSPSHRIVGDTPMTCGSCYAVMCGTCRTTFNLFTHVCPRSDVSLEGNRHAIACGHTLLSVMGLEPRSVRKRVAMVVSCLEHYVLQTSLDEGGDQ